MTRWFRFDCDAVRHPKVVELTDAEFRVWVEAIAYAAEHGTDGAIPAGWFRRMRVSDDAVETLVRVGLLERNSDSYALHDYLEHQPPASRWERASEAGRKAAAARWGGASRGASDGADQTRGCESHSGPHTSRNAERNATKTKTNTGERRPSKERGLSTSSAARDARWQEIFAALIAECGGVRPETKAEQGKYARAADEIHALDATGADVSARAARWRSTYSVPLTPPALVRHWSAMTPPRPRATGRFGDSRVIGGAA